jgi:hypothetical protein
MIIAPGPKTEPMALLPIFLKLISAQLKTLGSSYE